MKKPRFFQWVLVLALLVTLGGTVNARATGVPATHWGNSTPGMVESLRAKQSTYYVDIDHPLADDSNPGTESLPWRHCPGMPGWTGSTELQAGDTVLFNSAATWAVSSGNSIIQVVGGVTYDGKTWGTGTRATLRATGGIVRSVINFMVDHPTIPTVVRGFEVDVNNQVTSGIGMNWPQWMDHLTGATKRIEDCVVHDVWSRQSQGQYEYGIIIGTGQRNVSNVEIIGCTVYNISRDGVPIYPANNNTEVYISNVLIRGCEIYNTGQDPDYAAGRGTGGKNHVKDSIIEFNYIHDTGGAGIVANAHSSDFKGPENLTVRYNIIRNTAHAGIFVHSWGDKSLEIYGNLIINNAYHGIRLTGNSGTHISATVYNNTLFHNCQLGENHEISVESAPTITSLEVQNNVIFSSPDNMSLLDVGGDITSHSNNIYYRPGGGTLVTANGIGYTASNIGSWEPTALTSDPLLKNPADLPSGFIGAYGVDMEPNADGLNIAEDSPAKDYGASLGDPYAGSINSVTRPNGTGWDVGAYEYEYPAPELVVQGTPGNRTIHLDWAVNVTLPAASAWQVDYQGPAGDQPPPITGIVSPTRAYTLTGLTNYVWYTVTLDAMLDSTSLLSDTVCVMPTDIAIYLPLIWKMR